MITTKRCLIRRFGEEDWMDLYEYLSDPEVVKFEPYGAFTMEEAKAEAVSRSGNNDFYAVCLKESGKLIGNLYLAKGEFDTWELGYVFNRFYQGNGYASESATALLEFAFHTLHARRIVAMCNPKNAKSWRLLERLHMRREGELKENIFFKRDHLGNPIWVNTYEYAILKSEWEKLEWNQ